MKLKRWMLAAVCLSSLTMTSAQASPQTDDVKITAVVRVQEDGDKNIDKANQDTQDTNKERKSVRVQLNKGPVVMMRRAKLADDATANGDKSEATDEPSGENSSQAQPPKIWLGIGLKEIEGDLATYLGSNQGVFIESVFPDSPAEAGKLQEGDIILEFQGKQVIGPAELVEALREVKAVESKESGDDKATQYPSVTLKVLRRGKEVKLEVKPRERPKDLQVSSSGDQSEWVDAASIFKFGEPGDDNVMLMKPFTKMLNNIVVVVKEDGKDYTVRIERSGEGPAKITVNDGQGERQVKEGDIDQLPEKVRDAVHNALKSNVFELDRHSKAAGKPGQAKEQAWDEVREQIEKAMKQVGGKVEVIIDLKDLSESLKNLEKGRVIVIDPAKMQDVQKLSEDARSMAKKWAETGAEQAKLFSSTPEQLKTLKKEVQELKMQVEELKAQVKASKE